MEKIIFSKNRLKNEWFDCYSWFSISYPKGLTPADYLGFANEDLREDSTQRHLINSISNAKRALHLEVETLCNAFGLEYSKKKAKTFPQRLEFIGSCGMVRERLLQKLNNIRNLVEHEYYIPSRDEVENFIDVVDLFVEAMRMNRSRHPCEVVLSDALDDSGEFRAQSMKMDFQRGVISLSIVPVGNASGNAVHQEITVNDEEYFAWVSFILRNNG